MMEPGSRSLSNRVAVVTVIAVAVGFLVGWWAWPTLSGADDDRDVMVLDDGFLAASRRSVELRVREEGQSIEWLDVTSSDCAQDRLTAAVSRASPGRVVISLGDPACAAGVVADLADWTPIVLVQPGIGELPPNAAAVIDPTHLIGQPGPSLRMGCLWWEVCPPERSVEVRDAQANLTIAGGERVARLIAANV